jgi:uncharacterized protein YaaQ
MCLRLVIAILNRRVSGEAIRRLAEANYRVTRLASTGGFLNRGSTTLFVGVEDEAVDRVFEILRHMGAENAGRSGGGEPAVARTGIAWVTRVDTAEHL